MSTPPGRPGSPQRADFPTTHWSGVLAAGRQPSPQAKAALETLAHAYWHPVYAFIRRHGHDTEHAKDLTQEFFARLLHRNYPAQADPAKGRFRCFLLVTVRHFLSDERERANALKRGGGQFMLSADDHAADARYPAEPADQSTPETLFERRWAQTVLARASARRAEEYATAGKAATFDVLRDFRPGEQKSRSYQQAARDLGMSDSAVKALIHRMRRRHGDLVREEIAQTVANDGDVDDELRYLIRALSR